MYQHFHEVLTLKKLYVSCTTNETVEICLFYAEVNIYSVEYVQW
jgi:hypothetical protein